IDNLRGKDLHNGALVAIDYRTGNVLAYVGSAGYYRDDLASAKFDPKYDVVSAGYRQPGSAFKPIMYATAFDDRRLTPGSVLLGGAGYGRCAPDRPHRGIRRERERCPAAADAAGAQGERPRQQDRLPGQEEQAGAGCQSPGGLPRERRPRRQHRPLPEPALER